MTLLTVIGISIVALVVLFVVRNTFNAGGRFWRLVGRYPDLTLRLLTNERDVFVDQDPPNRSDCSGPFTLFDSEGKSHKIYILFARIDEVQSRITDAIKEHANSINPITENRLTDAINTENPLTDETAKTILVGQTRENLAVAERFDPDLRRAMAKHFYMTQVEIGHEMRPEEKISQLTELTRFWFASRHDALRRGADSEEHVGWNTASCVEAWVIAELSFRKGQLSAEHSKTIGELLRKFIQDNLSVDEQRQHRPFRGSISKS